MGGVVGVELVTACVTKDMPEVAVTWSRQMCYKVGDMSANNSCLNWQAEPAWQITPWHKKVAQVHVV